jgi:hypothetical protein
MRRTAALAGLWLALAVTPGHAQAPAAPSDAVKALAGGWELSNADHDRVCTVILRADPSVPGGFKLEPDKTCAATFPFVKDMTAWKIGARDVLQLLDPRGRALAEFSEVESGMYEAERPGEGIFFMQSLASLEPPAHTAEQMMGDWAVMRGTGKPLCSVTLTNTTVDQDSFMLTLKPGCDAAVVRFGLSSWHMDRGELLLVSPRGVWRFEESDATSWRRVPETQDATTLVRQ